MQAKDLKVGLVVRLNSGGPSMTIVMVTGEDMDEASCEWICEDGSADHARFSAPMLTVVPMAGAVERTE